jgi:hypothetical protein
VQIAVLKFVAAQNRMIVQIAVDPRAVAHDVRTAMQQHEAQSPVQRTGGVPVAGDYVVGFHFVDNNCSW